MNCSRFGHTADKCRKLVQCGYCGKTHRSKDCSLINVPDKQFCINCKEKGQNVFSRKCSVFLRLLGSELERVNHTYEKVFLD